MALPLISDALTNSGAPRAVRGSRRNAQTLAVVFAALGAVVTSALTTAPAQAAINYSDDPMAPTLVNMALDGTYTFDLEQAGVGFPSFACVSGQNCIDYVTINVPSGREIDAIKLSSYDSTDDRVFLAIMNGTQFTATPDWSAFTLPGALAYNHAGWSGLCAQTYGPKRPSANAANNCIQMDNATPVPGTIVDLLATSSIGGSPAAVGSLPAGNYSIWFQQVSGESRYTVVASTRALPVPGPLPLLGAAAGFSFTRCLRRRVKQSQGS